VKMDERNDSSYICISKHFYSVKRVGQGQGRGTGKQG
jgi:hypothetical protein